jgi:hypothetical protein
MQFQYLFCDEALHIAICPINPPYSECWARISRYPSARSDALNAFRVESLLKSDQRHLPRFTFLDEFASAAGPADVLLVLWYMCYWLHRSRMISSSEDQAKEFAPITGLTGAARNDAAGISVANHRRYR